MNTHSYYSQFVNDSVKKIVLSKFTVEDLTNMLSLDKHLNTIPNNYNVLREWQSLAGMRFPWLYVYDNVVSEWYSHGGSGALKTAVIRKVKEAKESWTPSTAVCILKTAARIIVEENKGEHSNV